MKIDNNNLNIAEIAGQYKKMQQNQNKENKKVQNDKMQISDKAKDIIQSKKELQKRPEVRTEKVAALKERIENGSYKVDSKKIAVKILKNLE
ncbi:MAG: flagellar biosynthesis anti-sigma factor FlgM [Halanaerobiales bacterium]|nr:flagellar biosynthesis anti-sigma factor FlgM [Halanaerobiales bacterium]